ncbi:MAG: hypothetical protein KDD60_02185 [Bdellovibrionales bacterium]|nr:hypothetical protein [Bdellovibrionales bacterium]
MIFSQYMVQNTDRFIFRWLRMVLRGVVRVALRNSLHLQEFVEILKIVYLQEAESALRSSGKAISASKIAAMTGVHRRDISRFTRDNSQPSPKLPVISQIIVQWRHNPRFATKAGKPRVLGAEGDKSEFAELVNTINGGNLNHYTLLFEMERLGAIERKNKRVRLLWREYAPEVTQEEGLEMLAEDVDDLFSAVGENLELRPSIPNLHLKTEFTRIPAKRIDSVRTWLLKEGSDFHGRVRSYLSQFDRDFVPVTTEEETLEDLRIAFVTYSLASGGGFHGPAYDKSTKNDSAHDKNIKNGRSRNERTEH